MFFVTTAVHVATVPDQVRFIRLAAAFILRCTARADLFCYSAVDSANDEDRTQQDC